MARGVPTMRPGLDSITSNPSFSDTPSGRVKPTDAESGAERRAKPKSSTLMCPEGSTITFSDLRSRWTTSLPWAAAKAEAIWRP